MLAMQENRSKLFYAVLSLPATSYGFALSVQIAALSWILTTRYGLDIHDIGLVWAAGPLAGIVGQVVIGGLSDRTWLWNGRRRPFIVIGGVVAALMLLALPSLDVISGALGLDGVLGVALVVVLTLDFAINVGFNPTRSLIADVTPSGIERTKGYTWMQTVSGTISVAAYAIGVYFNNYVLIYFGAALVLLLSTVPVFFIEEPELIESDEITDNSATPGIPLRTLLQNIQPLWGFLIYDLYAMSLRIAGIEYQHYYAEIVCATLTIFLVVKSQIQRDEGASTATQHAVQFRKVVAANSFSWIGAHAMFVFMVAYVQYRMPALDDNEMGKVVSMSFLILTAVAALLPVLVLEPISERIGRIKTHSACLGIMAIGYGAMYLFGTTPTLIYVLIVVIAVGWASMISLPFAIMSQKIDKARMGLYMGLFNLSVVLPQLVVSLGVSLALSRASDKSIVFVISAVTIALSSISWLAVREDVDSMRSSGSASSNH